MAKKVHPKIFRINTNERYLSNWFASKRKDFVSYLHQDIKIREIVNKLASIAGIDRIVISRSNNNVSVDIYVAKPGLAIGKGGTGISTMEKTISKEIGQSVAITVHEIKQPYMSAAIVAHNIVEAIQKRIPPKIVMRQQLDRIEATGAKGARIEISGIGPVKQARTERVELRGGKIPLTTLRSRIDYSHSKVLSDKMFGIKVWIFKGES